MIKATLDKRATSEANMSMGGRVLSSVSKKTRTKQFPLTAGRLPYTFFTEHESCRLLSCFFLTQEHAEHDYV